MESDQKKLIPLITLILREWHEVNSPEAIREQIFERLNRSRDEILLKLLGFNKDSWGDSWSLDHCNGRSGNSIAGDYLKKVQQEAVDSWLATTCLPALSETQKKQIQSSFRSEFFSTLKDEIQIAARNKAKKLALELVDKMTPIENIDAHLELLNVIVPD